MTSSRHGDRSARKRRVCLRSPALLAGLVLIGGLAASAVAEDHESDHGAADVIQVVTTNVQGKNIYIPSTIVVEEGQPTTLSIFNTTEIPHGFTIEGLGIEFILPAQEEFEVKLPALDGDKIYKIRCQLHPAHRSAQLVVLDTD